MTNNETQTKFNSENVIEQKKEMSHNIRSNHEEYQYLDLMQTILETGHKRLDRTGTGTLSVFAPKQLRFSLQNDTLPLLTTKRVFWRGVIEELLWFLRGDTNANHLRRRNVHIWDGNASREYLDSVGLSDRPEGDLGPVYGFQWRHFGAEYIGFGNDNETDDMITDEQLRMYKGKGFDQLADVIDKIRNHPHSRRIIMSAWNPADLCKMALPPCHMFCQFYVENHDETQKPKLSCMLYQRSADTGLGVPFNIASYAALTHIIALVCDMLPGEFIHTIGDAHLYLNHLDAVKEQLAREPRTFPRLKISETIQREENEEVFNLRGSGLSGIEKLKVEDFEIVDYKPCPKISMKMSV